MNERIRQLAEQAGMKECALGYGMPENVLWGDDQIKNFAELIVQECVGILMTPEYPMNHPEELGDYNRGWVNGRLLGIEHIREHFEVES
jgi:hypothetical protein